MATRSRKPKPARPNPTTLTAVTDPVCRRQLNPRDAVGTAEYRDETFAFCSRACRAEFEAHPDRYSPAR